MIDVMAFYALLFLFLVVCLLTPLTKSWCCHQRDSGLLETLGCVRASVLSLMDLS